MVASKSLMIEGLPNKEDDMKLSSAEHHTFALFSEICKSINEQSSKNNNEQAASVMRVKVVPDFGGLLKLVEQ